MSITAERLQFMRYRALAITKAKQAKAQNPTWRPLPHQVPPPEDDDWVHFLILGGRGSGKTDGAAHYIDSRASAERIRVAIAAPTLHDARSTCVEGETGLLAANPLIRFNRSSYELTWPNGSKGQLFGAYAPEDAERWRGPQHHLVWADELAAWRQLDACWDQMRFGLRLGSRPRIVITTTPRPVKRLKMLLTDPLSVIRRATTNDNPHLHADVRAELQKRYEGTRLGRQELGGELLEDIEGALWQYGWIDNARVKHAPCLPCKLHPEAEITGTLRPSCSVCSAELQPLYRRVVVAIDPAATSGEDSDETGIALAARGQDEDYYVMQSHGLHVSPKGWAEAAIGLYDAFGGDRIIAEVNNGGEMVESTLQAVKRGVPFTKIHASRGKIIRAEPVAALYEQAKVHHIGTFGPLEDQMCQYTGLAGEDSPDRMDALVYAITALMSSGGGVRFFG